MTALRVVTEDRRVAVGDRRMAERVPREWERAQPLVADYLHRLTENGEDHGRRLDRVESGQAELRRTIRTAMWVLSGAMGLACLIGSTAVIQATRYYTDQALAPAVLSQQERVEEIIDVLPDIGAGPGERRVSGRPTVAAVRRALPQVRGITAAEIQSACLMVPEACTAP